MHISHFEEISHCGEELALFCYNLLFKYRIHTNVWANIAQFSYKVNGTLNTKKTVQTGYKTSRTDVICKCYGLHGRFMPNTADVKIFDGAPLIPQTSLRPLRKKCDALANTGQGFSD